MRKLTLKITFFASLLTLLLSGCAEENFTLAGTEWHAEYTQTSGNPHITYKDYAKFVFEKDKVQISLQKINATTYAHGGFIKYTYDSKTQILKLVPPFMMTLSGGQVKNPPLEVTADQLKNAFIVSLDGKSAIEEGIKVTKDTKELDIEATAFNITKRKLKRVK